MLELPSPSVHPLAWIEEVGTKLLQACGTALKECRAAELLKDLEALEAYLRALHGPGLEHAQKWWLFWIRVLKEAVTALQRGDTWDWRGKPSELQEKLGVGRAFPDRFWQALAERLRGEGAEHSRIVGGGLAPVSWRP